MNLSRWTYTTTITCYAVSKLCFYNYLLCCVKAILLQLQSLAMLCQSYTSTTTCYVVSKLYFYNYNHLPCLAKALLLQLQPLAMLCQKYVPSTTITCYVTVLPLQLLSLCVLSRHCSCHSFMLKLTHFLCWK